MRGTVVMCLGIASLIAGCAPEGSSAYVSHNLPLSSSCIASPTAELFLAVGVYDIATGGDYLSARKSKNCQSSYFLHLLVNSNLKSNANDAIGRAEPNVLQINEAEVALLDVEEQATILFDARANPLPNPFRVKVNNTLPPTTGRDATQGVVAVEAIPAGYDEQLRDYIDKQIMAEVQIFGTTTGDVDIDFKPFSFPVLICEGCLTVCAKSLKDGANRADVYGDQCPDNAGADGRLCVDPAADCDAPCVGSACSTD